MIFEATTGPLGRVTPIVFGYELLQTRLGWMCGKPHGFCGEFAPLCPKLPLVHSRFSRLFRPDAVSHRKTFVVLAIYEASGGCNCPFGHDLGYENNSSSLLAALLPANVEAQIHLVEIGMKRNREASKQLRTAETKAHQADICLSLE